MAKRTKKVGTTGKFGARYGLKTKRKYKKIDERQRGWHICPACGHRKVKRESTGIWVCRKCNTTFAGGAYLPTTPSGIDAEKSLKGITGGK